jgi:hypothetical protein
MRGFCAGVIAAVGLVGCSPATSSTADDPVMTETRHVHYHVHAPGIDHGHTHTDFVAGGHTHEHEGH